VIILKVGAVGEGGVDVTCNVDQFLVTTCGDTNDNNVTGLNADERWVFSFFFDGTKYIATFDNC